MRIVQYKMILKKDLIAIQEDAEDVKRWGVPRPDAITYAERRSADPRTDPRVPAGQRSHRVPRPKPGRFVRLGRARVGGPGVRRARQEAERSGAGLHRQGDGIEPAPGDAIDPQIPRRRSGRNGAIPAAALPGEIHQPRRGAAGRSGSRARLAERAGDGVHYAARTPGVRQCRVCAPGEDLGGASVQPERQRRVPQAGGEMGADPSDSHQHRGAAQTGSARTARLSAHRHRAPRRLERSQRGVSHQCRGCGDAVAGSGLRGADQRAPSAAGAGGDLASVSLPDSGISFRQRLGIHQPRGEETAQESADRVHQEPRVSQPGQRAGRRQKRGDHSQAHGLRTHRCRTRRGGAPVPHGTPKPILKLSSTVWLRDGESGCARQTAAEIQAARLRNAVREVEEFTGSEELPKGRHELCAPERGSAEDERHRMGAEDGGGPSELAAALQERIAGRSGNGVRAHSVIMREQEPLLDITQAPRWGEKEKQPLAMTMSLHPGSWPLGISQKARDSHIPTAWHRPGWKSGKPKSGFLLSHAGLATTTIISLSSEQKTKRGDRPLRGLLTTFQDHPVLETETDFRIILRLENAQPRPTPWNSWG